MNDEISNLTAQLNESQNLKNSLSEEIKNLNIEREIQTKEIANLENQINQLNENEIKQLNNLINFSFSKSPSWIFSNYDKISPSGMTEEQVLEEMLPSNKKATKAQLFYKYYVNIKNENVIGEDEIDFWLKKSASYGHQLARLKLGINFLNDKDNDPEKIWYALQLLKIEISSGTSSGTLPKMIINQVNDKICDKLKIINFDIGENIINNWCD